MACAEEPQVYVVNAALYGAITKFSRIDPTMRPQIPKETSSKKKTCCCCAVTQQFFEGSWMNLILLNTFILLFKQDLSLPK